MGSHCAKLKHTIFGGYLYSRNKVYVVNDECSICLMSPTETPGEDFILTKCRHFFHHKCLIEWSTREPICPTCKQPL